MKNNSKSIITSASNKFFPSLINFIESIKENYPNHPTIYVYDLGLNLILKREIEKMRNVEIIKIPHFIKYWRSCYTWKTYILNTSITDLNIYIDSGCQILKPLDELFEKVNNQDYLLVSQGSEVLMEDVTPKEYIEIFDLNNDILKKEIIAAGIFGFKKDSKIMRVTEQLYDYGISGLCLGFSKNEQWKNKGVNRNDFIRNCRMFRHDTTVLSMIVFKYLENPKIESVEKFSGEKLNHPEQLIWNLRMNYKKLDYIKNANLNILAKIFIYLFLKAKALNYFIKFGK